MPGIAEVIDGAMQHAAHPVLHSIVKAIISGNGRGS
jgi:hypothetical protein